MRKKVVVAAGSVVVIILSWAIPYYLEVNQMITMANSYWLLVISIGVTFVFGIVLIWAIWPKLKQLRLQTPIRLNGRQVETKTETENSKVGEWPRIFRSIFKINDQYTHKCSQCGYGVVVSKYDMGVVCPKCGNADDFMPRL